jgi:hypothetical protein
MPEVRPGWPNRWVVLVALVTQPLVVALPSSAEAAGGIPEFDHIFVIVLENHAYSEIIGNTSQAPYLNQLAGLYGVANNYVAVTHPSLPNYLALTGGDTFGVTSDCTTCYVSAPNLVTDRIEPSGRTWRAYLENLPAACQLGDAYPYAQKHNPFVYYTDLRSTQACASNVVPMADFFRNLRTVTVTPQQDTFINSANPSSTSGGSAAQLNSDRWPQQTAFLRFDLSALAGRRVTGAALRIHTSWQSWAGSAVSHPVRFVNDNGWQEAWMSWNNSVAPRSIAAVPMGSLLAPLPNTWYRAPLDLPTVQAHVGGLWSMAIDAAQSDLLLFDARESGATTAPQLIITGY